MVIVTVAGSTSERRMGSEEYQPLLLGLNSHARIPDLSSFAVEEFLAQKPVAVRWWPRLFGWESRLLWLLSGSSIVASIFNYMLSFVTLMFTGHLGALELAGASIASVGIQGLAYGIMVCMFFFKFDLILSCMDENKEPTKQVCVFGFRVWKKMLSFS